METWRTFVSRDCIVVWTYTKVLFIIIALEHETLRRQTNFSLKGTRVIQSGECARRCNQRPSIFPWAKIFFATFSLGQVVLLIIHDDINKAKHLRANRTSKRREKTHFSFKGESELVKRWRKNTRRRGLWGRQKYAENDNLARQKSEYSIISRLM